MATRASSTRSAGGAICPRAQPGALNMQTMQWACQPGAHAAPEAAQTQNDCMLACLPAQVTRTACAAHAAAYPSSAGRREWRLPTTSPGPARKKLRLLFTRHDKHLYTPLPTAACACGPSRTAPVPQAAMQHRGRGSLWCCHVSALLLIRTSSSGGMHAGSRRGECLLSGC